jgi:ATP-dependent Lon protease
MPAFSAEGSVIRYYIDWIFSIPWLKIKDDEINLHKAEEILENEHYGLHKVKDRILDYLAVRILKKKSDGEVICLLGPPGVGKSSLAKSVANAIGREFVRISLGGLKDEAEIRGHRRTYIGAYPGQIVKGIKKAKCMNPVFLLDEIDKIDSNFRGDPASALMEVLDPELNNHFSDHYLDLEINLSKVFFITTANSLDSIPGPLRDRLEIIEISGYTELEKVNIAKQFLINKQALMKGLDINNYSIDKKELLYVINNYTREAGVRELERKVAIIMRKIARNIVKEKNKTRKIKINRQLITEFLGIPRYNKEKILKKPEIGVALGLAWTAFGGEILLIELRNIKGKGDLILTGRLGEIMKESSSTAFSYVKLKLYELGFDIDLIEKYNYHLHIPKGAVPKEGPSAGITLAVSFISLILGIPIKNDYAMTGEITLRGKILPVGGIKEKVIAAHRYGITNLIIPLENQKEFEEEIPDEIKARVKVNFMDNMDEVFRIVLTEQIRIDGRSSIIKHFSNNNIQ